MGNIINLLPVLLFLVGMLGISAYIQRTSTENRNKDFAKDYFIGGRTLGGFVLAMTTAATYSSVSTFVGGPGMAWIIGYGWLYMAIVQVIVIFLVLGVFGKKIALIAREIDAVTVIDVLRARYESNFLANLSALVIVAFFCSTMVAQFVGAAKLFEAVTGFSYVTGLSLFGLIVVIYTTIGGFKGVAVTDACCAVAMIVGMCILMGGMMTVGGGFDNIMEYISTKHPDMLEPLSRGKMPISLYISQWLLVGICTLSLPQSVVRGISYKDTKALHRAMIIGTIVIGAMTLVATWIGVLSKGILTDSLKAYGSVDNIIPIAIVKSLSPFWAGVIIIGPIAATISTVSSLLLATSSSIVKDVYMNIKGEKGETLSNNQVKIYSLAATIILGLIVYAIAIKPPTVIWQINMFAFGGLETAFFWVLIFGLFWPKANKYGAIAAMSGGVLVYCVTMAMKIKFMSLHQITLGIFFSLILFLIGNATGKTHDEKVLRIFFPEKFED
ncbi:sodium/pantothenate symporter [uncultured Phascolarctobacterium sp.]|uniref:sodium/pantothenate symporter n=1 Tax=uncultured Phascolarctobacterium sp. TaxID=512296 RepID=UPI00261E8BF4|nr:sodium/pantothenate symporter [uncultured Phascolarctobacterium sp.]